MASEKDTSRLQNNREEIKTADYSEQCKESILLFLDAYNPDTFGVNPPILSGKDRREQSLSTASRRCYSSALHNAAKEYDLTECTAADLNQLANERFSGQHPDVKDGGLAQNTIHQNQVAWRSYARFHQNHDEGDAINLDPDEIMLVDREDTKVDERDMFEPAEIEVMRDVCENKRDRAILDTLIYTGQRINVLRELQVKDVQPHEGNSGMLYIPDVEGMKGAKGKRPLLGAQKAVEDYKQSHPTGEPTDAFFTHTYSWSQRDDIEKGGHLSQRSISQITKRLADRADVEKPANPHQFRHYFVTMAISKHGMSMDTVRHLIGHAPGSRELEQTYQHLVDDDYIANAELDMGIKDEREESLTPATCFTCNEPLQPSMTFCPNCGRQYAPDGNNIEDEIQSTKAEGALQATDPQMQESVETVLEKVDDPAVLNQLIELAESLDVDSLAEASDSLSK